MENAFDQEQEIFIEGYLCVSFLFCEATLNV